jgi:hypothetical protein
MPRRFAPGKDRHTPRSGVSSTPQLLGSITDALESGAFTLNELPPIQFSNSRIDGRHSFAFPRRDAPGLCKNLSPKKTEGVGNAGCPLHPQPRAQRVVTHTSVVTTGPPEHPAFPHAMVLTAYFVLPPATNSSCHRHQRIKGLSKPGWADTPPPT